MSCKTERKSLRQQNSDNQLLQQAPNCYQSSQIDGRVIQQQQQQQQQQIRTKSISQVASNQNASNSGQNQQEDQVFEEKLQLLVKQQKEMNKIIYSEKQQNSNLKSQMESLQKLQNEFAVENKKLEEENFQAKLLYETEKQQKLLLKEELGQALEKIKQQSQNYQQLEDKQTRREKYKQKLKELLIQNNQLNDILVEKINEIEKVVESKHKLQNQNKKLKQLLREKELKQQENSAKKTNMNSHEDEEVQSNNQEDYHKKMVGMELQIVSKSEEINNLQRQLLELQEKLTLQQKKEEEFLSCSAKHIQQIDKLETELFNKNQTIYELNEEKNRISVNFDRLEQKINNLILQNKSLSQCCSQQQLKIISQEEEIEAMKSKQFSYKSLMQKIINSNEQNLQSLKNYS